MKTNRLKLKDIITIALLTAVYMLLYMIAMGASRALGELGHAISPGLNGVLAGSVILFMHRKVGKMWEYTIFTALLMGAMTLLGGGYLPWVVTSMVTALLADLIASRSRDASVLKVALASGVLHVGQAWGAIMPSLLFLNAYRDHWIARGMTPEAMDAQIFYTSGWMGILMTAVVFVLAFAGVWLGHLILRKHFEKMNRQAQGGMKA